MNANAMRRIQKADLMIRMCKEKYDTGDNGVDINLLLSAVCLRFGSGKRYVREILDDLIITNQLQLKDKLVFYIPPND